MFTKSKLTSLSIFFPCYNDEKTIGSLVENAFTVAKKVAREYEIIVVDDGSKDKSVKVLKDVKIKYPQLKLVLHKQNRGYGGALKSGFKNAKKDFVFYTDGDGQYDVNEITQLFMLMSPDVNFVNGIKMDRQDYAYRIILGNLYNFVVRWAFLLPIFDTDCDFRLIRKSLLDKIKLKNDSGSICVELVKKAQRAGGKFRQASVHHFERPHGQSQFFRPAKLWGTFMELTPLWINLIILRKWN